MPDITASYETLLILLPIIGIFINNCNWKTRSTIFHILRTEKPLCTVHVYREMMFTLYPSNCAILWTNDPILMERMINMKDHHGE